MRISTFARICVMTLKRSRLLKSIRPKLISIPQAKSAEPNPTPQRILADRSQRAPNIDGGVPLYYEDRKLHCADCGKQEVWTAKQQKWWYEVQKESTSLQAFKCWNCLHKYREVNGIKSRQPPLRIPADTSEQAPNNSYDPPTYYEDRKFLCADCGKPQIWTAEQQKWWYEVAKRSIYAHALRCRDCRQQRRTEKEEQRRRCEAGRKRKEELGDR